MKLPTNPILGFLSALLLFSFCNLLQGFPVPDDTPPEPQQGPQEPQASKGDAPASNPNDGENKKEAKPPKPPTLQERLDAGEMYRVNETFEEVFQIPARRNPTPYEEGKERNFLPVLIVPGDTPCIYKKYRYFFTQARILDVRPADMLKKTIIKDPNATDAYFYDAEDLCIRIEDELVIDAYHYDCNRAGICTCGLYYSYVDPNVPQPEPKNLIRRYLSINGLDRKLTVEDNLCVSDTTGHCTLPNSTAVEKLDCRSSLECVLEDSYGPILHNKVTDETYGICLPKKPESPPGENLSFEEYKRLKAMQRAMTRSNSYTFAPSFVVCLLVVTNSAANF